MTTIRRLLENCDSPNAICSYNSLCGGTGSGYTSKLIAVTISLHHILLFIFQDDFGEISLTCGH